MPMYVNDCKLQIYNVDKYIIFNTDYDIGSDLNIGNLDYENRLYRQIAV